ncbi:chitin disaccharide deacetylase [Terribacillus sp. DMT04]|uniref:chitin disaccharide deacetylase n=1 Tax=Terribacillus sp. DMT04 TaxID=2850441 RepID=UPI001C2C7C32|nr:chitin disaccharide deacetylase [Terribacillus sp. DMT04]QXE02463.1 chitin disaccharide deacetylase [Terribacillus sp. DMT04]
MKKLIINADDFGYSRAVNYGIIDCLEDGVLTSATMMPNMPGAEHAAVLAKAHKQLGVGIHLVLTCGKPLLPTHNTIVDSHGLFRNLAFYQGSYTIDADEVEAEWEAQIERFLSFGLTPTHLDSHHHINTYNGINKVFLRLAKKYDLPVRHNMQLPSGQIATDKFEPSLEKALANEEALLAIFGDAETLEVMSHPGYLDKAIYTGSAYNYARLDEVELLTSKRVIDWLTHSQEVELVSFAHVGHRSRT